MVIGGGRWVVDDKEEGDVWILGGGGVQVG